VAFRGGRASERDRERWSGRKEGETEMGREGFGERERKTDGMERDITDREEEREREREREREGGKREGGKRGREGERE
jgi:hypothetical protein